jgi:hypothetical protein
MKELNKIFADFHNADIKGRVRLNTNGTLDDLKNKNIKLEPGLEILLDDDDGLSVKGIIQFSEEEKMWVAEIDWDQLNR